MSEIGEAFITVRPDIEFGNLLRDITRQVDQAAEVIETQTESMERSFRDLAETIRTELRQGFDRVERQAEAAGESLQRSFEEAARQSEDALNEIGGAFAFERVQRQAESAGESIERSFREASRQSERHLRGLSIVSGTFFGNIAAQAASALARALVEVGQFGLQLAGQLEVAASSFEILLGSAQEADTFIRDLQKFAAETPFEFAQITDTSRRLLAVADAAGIARDEVIPTIGVFGDMITLLGQPQASLNRVILAFGQIASRGKVVTQELRQISEALPGFNPFEALARGFNVTTAEMTKMVEDGAVPAREGIAILIEEMRNFPGAAGSMERFTATITGTWQKFTDTLQIALAEGLQPLLPTLKDLLNGLVPLLELGLTPLIAAVNDFVEKAIPPLITSLEVLGPAFADFMGALFEGITGFGSDFEPIIEGLAVGLESLGDILRSLGRALGPIFSTVFGQLSETLPIVTDAITTFIDTVGPPLARALQPVAELFGAILEAAAPVLVLLGEVAAEVIEALTPALDEVGEALEIVAAALGEALLAVLEELGPELPELARAFGELAVALADVLVALTPILVPLAELAAIVLAGSVSTLTDALNLLADIITFLTPIVDGLAFVIGEVLAPAVSDVVRFFQNFRDTIIGRLVDGLENLYNDVLLPLGDFVGGAFLTAWETLGDIWDGVVDAAETIYDILNSLWNDIIVPLGRELEGPFTDVWNALAGPLGDVGDAVDTIYEILDDLWHDIIEPLGVTLRDVFIEAWDELDRIWDEDIVPAAGEVRDALSDLWDEVEEIAASIRENFLRVWDELVRVWRESIQPALSDLKDAFDDLLTAIDPIIELIRENWVIVLGLAALALGPFIFAIYLAIVALDVFNIDILDVAEAVGVNLLFGFLAAINILSVGFVLAVETAGRILRLFLETAILPVARILGGLFSATFRVVSSLVTTVFSVAVSGATQLLTFMMDGAIRPVARVLSGLFRQGVEIASGVIRVFAGLIGTTARVIGGTLGTAVRTIAGMLRGALVSAINIAQGAWEGFLGVLGSVIGALESTIRAAQRAISLLSSVRSGATAGIGEFIEGLGSFGFQHGGFVNAPLSGLPAVLHGPELILPLSDQERSLQLLSQSNLLDGLNGGNTAIALTVVVNVTGAVSGQDAQRIGDTVGSAASRVMLSTLQQRRIAAISRVR